MADTYRLAHGELGKVIVARVAPGSDLYSTLAKIADEQGITYGLILGGAASLRQTVLRNPRGFIKEFPITDKNRVETRLQGPLEMLALSGNISRKEDGTVWVHAHITVSTGSPDGLAYGGHLVEGSIVYTTCEVALAEVTGVKLLRKYDPETKNIEMFVER